MERATPTREARRILVVVLVARLVLLAMAALVGLAVRPGVSLRFPTAPVLPTAMVLVLTIMPWAQRALGPRHLAAVLALDVLVMSMHAMPVFFLKQPEALESLALAGVPVAQMIEASITEPFLLLLLPLVLIAWAYGRRGALWGSTWATFWHLGTGFWALKFDLLSRSMLAGESLRILLIYSLPLIVSTLAQRERRQVAELERAHARLQRHAATVEQLAVSRERNRLARDLHDTLAHSLSGLTVQLQAVRALLANEPSLAEKAVDEAVSMARQGLDESRDAILALRDDPLVALGLVGAARAELESLKVRTGVAVDFSVAGQEPDLTEDESRTLFRILEEALSNVERHASAQHVAVRLAFGTNKTELTVRDDGVGFDPESVDPDRYGLLGMRERAALVGAQLRVQSQPNGGVEVWCALAR